MAVDALSKRAQFPRPDVPGQHQHAPPAIGRSLIVLKPIVLDQLCDVLTRELRELRELAKKPAEIAKHSLHDSVPVSGVEFGNGEGKVSISHAP